MNIAQSINCVIEFQLSITVLLSNPPVCAVTHLAPQHGFDSYTGYEVGPDDMQHLEDQQ